MLALPWSCSYQQSYIRLGKTRCALLTAQPHGCPQAPSLLPKVMLYLVAVTNILEHVLLHAVSRQATFSSTYLLVAYHACCRELFLITFSFTEHSDRVAGSSAGLQGSAPWLGVQAVDRQQLGGIHT